MAGRGFRKDGKPSPFGPPLEASRKLKDLMSLHYLQGRYADGAVPVAWVTSGFPVEFLRPFDFHVVYPENHGALCGARRMAPELAAVAEREGYSRDLCAYARADIGSDHRRRRPGLNPARRTIGQGDGDFFAHRLAKTRGE